MPTDSCDTSEFTAHVVIEMCNDQFVISFDPLSSTIAISAILSGNVLSGIGLVFAHFRAVYFRHTYIILQNFDGAHFPFRIMKLAE